LQFRPRKRVKPIQPRRENHFEHMPQLYLAHFAHISMRNCLRGASEEK